MTLADSLSVKLTAGEAVGWKEQIFSIYFLIVVQNGIWISSFQILYLSTITPAYIFLSNLHIYNEPGCSPCVSRFV